MSGVNAHSLDMYGIDSLAFNSVIRIKGKKNICTTKIKISIRIISSHSQDVALSEERNWIPHFGNIFLNGILYEY